MSDRPMTTAHDFTPLTIMPSVCRYCPQPADAAIHRVVKGVSAKDATLIQRANDHAADCARTGDRSC